MYNYTSIAVLVVKKRGEHKGTRLRIEGPCRPRCYFLAACENRDSYMPCIGKKSEENENNKPICILAKTANLLKVKEESFCTRLLLFGPLKAWSKSFLAQDALRFENWCPFCCIHPYSFRGQFFCIITAVRVYYRFVFIASLQRVEISCQFWIPIYCTSIFFFKCLHSFENSLVRLLDHILER